MLLISGKVKSIELPDLGKCTIWIKSQTCVEIMCHCDAKIAPFSLCDKLVKSSNTEWICKRKIHHVQWASVINLHK